MLRVYVPGQSVSGQSVPDQSVPGQSLPGQSVPGQSVPGQSVPGQVVPTARFHLIMVYLGVSGILNPVALWLVLVQVYILFSCVRIKV